jgi:photosystem II stability/assembly factor-like uncharacterized protein
MNRSIRSLLLWPISIVALIATIALLLSLGNPQILQGQTAVPTSTVPPTVSPLPTPVQPPAPPTPRPIPISDSRVRANGWILQEVVGNRLSSTIYGVAIAPRLYRSDDDGRTWSLLLRNPPITDFLMSPASPATLYSTLPIDCADDLGPTSLYRSDNGGVTWTPLNQGFDLLPLLADPTDEDVVIAAGCDGLYRTEDGGWSWSPLSTAPENPVWEQYSARQIAPVYFGAGEIAALKYLYALVAAEQGESRLLFSGDSGATWTEITPPDVEVAFNALTVDLWEVGRVWLSEEGGVWSTEDQGQYWGLSRRGLDDAIDRGLSDILLTPSERLYLGSGLGLYSKEVANPLWEKVGNRTIQRQDVQSLLYTESGETQIWINAANGVYKLAIEP